MPTLAQRPLAAPSQAIALVRPLLVALLAFAALSPAHAQPVPPAAPTLAEPTLAPPQPAAAPSNVPFIDLKVGGEGSLPTVLKVMLLLGALTFLPAILLAMTSFTRIIVVLSMVRQGIGVMQLPPNRVLVALALFLTAFTMAPVFGQIHDQAYVPWEAGQLADRAALDAAMEPLRKFMLSHTRESDLMLFIGLAGDARPDTAADVSTLTLVPAFMLSELKTAFQMGALLFLPFLVIELVVGSVLMSMGMMMLPPATISLPLKILVFVAVDGWGLVVGSLAESFKGTVG
jgi:flagellar biosynthetic protein FliP